MKNVVIAGNCTKDAELRTTQNGSKVAGFSVAVNGFANGEKTTDFFDVSIWGKRGEAVMQFAKKGAKICVSGELGTREYNGKTYLTVNAHDFTPMGGNAEQGNYGQSDPARQAPQGGAPAGGGFDDSIPFAPIWWA
jgi:single-strand DNA-binding protein